VLGIALIFAVLGWGVGVLGVTAAMVSFIGGRLWGNAYLAGPVRAALAAARR
jgi:hypothetical protein